MAKPEHIISLFSILNGFFWGLAASSFMNLVAGNTASCFVFSLATSVWFLFWIAKEPEQSLKTKVKEYFLALGHVFYISFFFSSLIAFVLYGSQAFFSLFI